MMTKDGFNKLVNFMNPGAGCLVQRRDHISYIVNIHYFWKNLLLYSQAQIRQTKFIVMMTKEGSTNL